MLAPYLPRSAHQAYGYSLAIDRFCRSGAKEWVLASARAVSKAEPAALPVDVVGAFDADKPDAVGISFAVAGGRRIYIEVETQADDAALPTRSSPFVDLFAAGGERLEPIE